MSAGVIGGIDLGGTKIEARLFEGPEAATVRTRRVPTPLRDFETLAAAVAEQIGWLEREGGQRIPVGVAVPGVIDPVTGEGFASNVPLTGRSLAAELSQARGRPVPVVNDCMAFALSEARGGAGEGARVVMGLVLGTGVGGGLCIDGAVPPRHAGLAVEIGHVAASARALARHDLPLLPCGCGREGCVETYVSGTGIANIGKIRTGRRIKAHEGPPEDVLAAWEDVAGDMLAAIQMMLDPDVIVLGGGLSNMDGIEERLSRALSRSRLGEAKPPRILRARHGDSSGARGAALLAAAAC